MIDRIVISKGYGDLIGGRISNGNKRLGSDICQRHSRDTIRGYSIKHWSKNISLRTSDQCWLVMWLDMSYFYLFSFSFSFLIFLCFTFIFTLFIFIFISISFIKRTKIMDKAGKNISQEAPWWLYFTWLIPDDIIGLQSSKRLQWLRL